MPGDKPSVQFLICGDNYIYLLTDGNEQCIVIDPGHAGAVLTEIEKQNLRLTDILLTHYHADHTAGVESLKEKTHCRIIGPAAAPTAKVDTTVQDNQLLELGGFAIRAIATPGHTSTSFCYILQSASGSPQAIFTGDTLFVAGCGRLIAGHASQMYQSLQKIAALPDDTAVYPGHDYTLENYRFALTVEPDNAMIRRQLSYLEEKGSMAVMPSTIGMEKQTNPFLRTQSRSIRNTLGMRNAADTDIFAELRRRKNFF